tara:strand:- start:151 stop:603 length:453 start_codon:yes stop_codon:yes gene_type:complete
MKEIHMEKLQEINEFGKKMLEDASSSDDQKFGSFYLSRLMGFNISYNLDTCEVSFNSIPPMFNPQGSLHGGIVATAMDVSMGHLLHQTTGSGATLEMNIKYLLPIFAECVTCKGSYLRQGKSISFLQSHMYKENGKLAAYASATWIPLKK